MRGSARPRPPATVPTSTTLCVGMTARHTTTAVSWDASKLHQNDVTYQPHTHYRFNQTNISTTISIVNRLLLGSTKGIILHVMKL